MRSSVILVADEAGRTVGGATALSNRVLVTCAHVVGFAHRGALSSDDGEAPPIHVRFPMSSGGSEQQATVAAQLPLDRPGTGDIALLLLDDPLPPDTPVPSWTTPEVGREIRALGYPSTDRRQVPSQWINGVCGDQLGTGWFQIEDKGQTGYWVTPGFSGSPIWDRTTWTALGILVAVEADGGARVAFGISGDYLAKWAALSWLDEDLVELATSYDHDRLSYVKEVKRQQLRKSDLLLTSGSLRSLADFLQPGELCKEMAEVAITGIIGTQFFTGLLVATDRRVILVYKFPTAPAIIKDYPYSQLRRIDWGFKSWAGSSSTVRFEAGHRRRLSVTEFDWDRMTALVEYARGRLEDAQRGVDQV